MARLGFRGTEQNTLDGDAVKVFHSLGCSANNGVSFRLFQLFPAEKPGGFPSPESGTGCIGLSTALSEQPPRGQTGGIEHCALPKAAPEGHIRSGRGAFRFGPSDTLVEVRPSHSTGSPRLSDFPRGLSFPASCVRLVVECGSGNGDTVHRLGRHRISGS